MLDWKVDVSSGRAEIRAEYGDCISFEQVEAYTPPEWPTQEAPQQMHIDVIVDDLDAAEAAVIDLGATKHDHQPGTSFRVFLDPASTRSASGWTESDCRTTSNGSAVRYPIAASCLVTCRRGSERAYQDDKPVVIRGDRSTRIDTGTRAAENRI
jgi:Glyoxalase-like domain